MKLKSNLFILLLFSTFHLIAQIHSGELPPSFYAQHEKSNQAIPIYQVEQPNINALKKQDKVEQKNKEKPWRFGTLIPVDIKLTNTGVWSADDDTGISRWKLIIKAPNAISINLNFRKFFLSENAKLYFFNQSYTDVLGAITSRNNKTDSLFSIRPIKGEELYIELEVPTAEKSQLIFDLNEVVYGYRDLHEKALKLFNGSGSCNIDINCPEGKNWQDLKRAVALITAANNTRFCTGTLINNVRQDTTPYFLSAAHCGIKNNSIFIFGYESLNCTPTTDGVLTNSISGASPKAVANSSQPDFHLFELSSRPPSSYEVFYAGWSAVNQAAPKTVTIHHPTGDVKKISINTDSIITSGYYNPSGTTHWTVNDWESGTTESGSSGAPLFDQNLRIIGQLHGGDAACGKNAQDYYGKFAVSWNSNSTKSRQLKAWLDPDTTNKLILDGLDPSAAAYNNDVQLLGIFGIPKYACDTLIQPILSVRNKGSNQIDSLEVIYSIDSNSSVTVKWIGAIERNQVVQFQLPASSLLSGLHQMDAEISILPLTTIDQDSSNNSASLSFETNHQPQLVNYTLRTDDYGDETSWSINGPSGNKLFSDGPFAAVNGGSTLSTTLCLYDDCFNLNLFDSFGDGFNGQFGNGFALITDLNGDTLLFENNFISDKKTISFCVPAVPTAINERKLETTSYLVYPNPVVKNGILTIKNSSKWEMDDALFQLLDVAGKIRMEFSSQQVKLDNEIAAGVYFLIIKPKRNETLIQPQKIIVQ